ncbi:unnamed protein product [Dovyalis caffra]|uniref:Uncharacterized protein n=1 Tax=Dovyalis caffra TaxID=77055 RepID=A0AAV1S988_9ROSI|nr:unnamed protein product [Dovyalis caffra]
MIQSRVLISTDDPLRVYSTVVDQPADQANTQWQMENLKADIFGNLHCFHQYGSFLRYHEGDFIAKQLANWKILIIDWRPNGKVVDRLEDKQMETNETYRVNIKIFLASIRENIWSKINSALNFFLLSPSLMSPGLGTSN